MSTIAWEPELAAAHDDHAARPARRSRSVVPIVATSLFIALMWMLATNDTSATGRFQEQGRGHIQALWLRVEDGRSTRQIALVLLGLWGVAASLWPTPRPVRIRITRPVALGLCTLLAWATSSLIWSADRSFTAKRLVVLACVAAGIAGFVRQFRVRDLITLAFVGFSLQVFADVVADALWHVDAYTSSDYRLSGLQHPNHTGIAAAFLVMGAVGLWDRTRRLSVAAVLGAATVVLLATKSRSALFACIAGVAVYGLIRLTLRQLVAIAIVGVLGIATFEMASAAGALPADLDALVHMGRTDTGKVALTGRPMVWAAAMEVLGSDRTRLLTGAGYDSFWTPQAAEYVSTRVWFGISEGHNAYFDMLLELGVVGSACYAFCLFAGCTRWAWLARRRANPSFAFCAAVCAFALVHGLTESTMSDPSFGTFVLFAAIARLAFRAPRDPSEVSQ